MHRTVQGFVLFGIYFVGANDFRFLSAEIFRLVGFFLSIRRVFSKDIFIARKLRFAAREAFLPFALKLLIEGLPVALLGLVLFRRAMERTGGVLS